MVEIKTLEERIENLLKIGKETGVITFEKLAEGLKGLDIDGDSLDKLYNILVENNIMVVSVNPIMKMPLLHFLKMKDGHTFLPIR